MYKNWGALALVHTSFAFPVDPAAAESAPPLPPSPADFRRDDYPGISKSGTTDTRTGAEPG